MEAVSSLFLPPSQIYDCVECLYLVSDVIS